MTYSSFSSFVEAFTTHEMDRAQRVFRRTGELALERVRELTPEESGVLRQSIGNGLGEGEVPELGSTLVIGSDLPWAAAVEFGGAGVDGHQPGHGMFQQTAVELPQLFERALNEVGGS